MMKRGLIGFVPGIANPVSVIFDWVGVAALTFD